MSLTPQQRRLRAQMGAYALHAQYDPRETTAKARRTFLSKFEDQVDPDRVLPLDERTRRAEAALRAHMKGLALRSSQARGSRRGAGRRTHP